MDKEGKYIYCIIGTKQDRNFGPIGIGGRGNEVMTVGYEDLSIVISNHPMTKIVVNQDNILAHQKVIEEVMKEFDNVLPVRFGTIASSADEIRNLLDRRYREFKQALRDMDHKVELGVKGIWKDMDIIFREITEDNKDIRNLKETIMNDKVIASGKGTSGDDQLMIEIGRMVENGLEKKKEEEAEKILNALRRTAFDNKLNQTVGDGMFMNSSFLVDKGREKEFDNIMDDLSEEYKGRIEFMYSGPLPVFNFVNIAVYPEEWEK